MMMSNGIDWEQRRYEIAKEVYPTMLQWLIGKDNTIAQQAIKENRAARNAVHFADQLIKELKK